MFARAREKARQTNCLSNIKQMGLAWTMYRGLRRARLPGMDLMGSWPDAVSSWNDGANWPISSAVCEMHNLQLPVRSTANQQCDGRGATPPAAAATGGIPTSATSLQRHERDLATEPRRSTPSGGPGAWRPGQPRNPFWWHRTESAARRTDTTSRSTRRSRTDTPSPDIHSGAQLPAS